MNNWDWVWGIGLGVGVPLYFIVRDFIRMLREKDEEK